MISIDVMSQPTLIAYVDIDDTLVRTAGTKRIPIAAAVRHVQALHAQGAQLYCWSSGGAAYAESSAKELGLQECFIAFLPKPELILDDQHPSEWRRLIHVHPAQVDNASLYDYLRAVGRST